MSAVIIMWTVFLIYTIVIVCEDEARHKRRFAPATYEHAFVCPLCRSEGISQVDPEFNCGWCDGVGLLIYSNWNSCMEELADCSSQAQDRHVWTRAITPRKLNLTQGMKK